ncbi:MAG: ABC transporter permease subunit [Fastidiosipila sp.]|jgi:NitT/TauT family transport system permease protein|nr:ABC transporter permease subunit [Fastidiosipila sp.]
MKTKISRMKFIQNVFWFLLIIIFWEVSSRLNLVNQYLLPPFSKVAERLVLELFTGYLGLQVLNSLKLVILGVLMSFGLASIIALMCICSKTIESLVSALCTIFNPLPGIAVLPLLMIWFGVGNGIMLALIVHGVLWPLTTNLLVGFRSIPTVYKEWAKNIGLSPVNSLLHVQIFSVMPYLVAGLRVGWGRAWRALIGAEMVFGMIGTVGGVGYYIYTNRAYANVTNVFSGVIVIIVIGILVEQAFRLLEKNTTVKWGMSDES